jgi:hypothetical protein
MYPFWHIGSLWHGFKKTFGLAHSHKDEKADEHRDGFTALVKELKNSLRSDDLLLTTTVLPSVDTSVGSNLLSGNNDRIPVLKFYSKIRA